MWPEGEKERVVEFTSDAIKALEKGAPADRGRCRTDRPTANVTRSNHGPSGADEAAAEAAEPVRLVRPVRP